MLFFFTAEIVSEDSILKWNRDAHSQKGKGIFLEQMKKFIEWLENAEEGEARTIAIKQLINLYDDTILCLNSMRAKILI